MESERRRKKLSRYIKNNDTAKLKSYIKKYDIDVENCRLEHGNTLLHCACRCGSDLIVR